jgi:hypothetical protein
LFGAVVGEDSAGGSAAGRARGAKKSQRHAAAGNGSHLREKPDADQFRSARAARVAEELLPPLEAMPRLPEPVPEPEAPAEVEPLMPEPEPVEPEPVEPRVVPLLPDPLMPEPEPEVPAVAPEPMLPLPDPVTPAPAPCAVPLDAPELPVDTPALPPEVPPPLWAKATPPMARAAAATSVERVYFVDFMPDPS